MALVASVLAVAAVCCAQAQDWRVIDLDLRTETPAAEIGDTVYVELYAVDDNEWGTDEPFATAVFAYDVPANANLPVDLELRCTAETRHVGDIVDVHIFAVGQNEPFCLLDCLLQWDPTELRLVGEGGAWPPDPTSGGQWMFQGFPPDSGLGGINNTNEDGTADYQAWASMGPFPEATPAGLLIDTLHFEALAIAPNSTIEIPLSFNMYSHSAIYDEQYGGWNLLAGRRGCSIIIIESAPATLADLAGLLSVYGEMNDEYDSDGDGAVGLVDLSEMLNRIRSTP
jgi:hypothetical protein